MNFGDVQTIIMRTYTLDINKICWVLVLNAYPSVIKKYFFLLQSDSEILSNMALKFIKQIQ